MNASRLLETVTFFSNLDESHGLQRSLMDANVAVANLAGNPSNASYQTELARVLNELSSAFISIGSEVEPGQWVQLSEINGTRFFSVEMLDEIKGWISSNTATPAVAASFLGNLVSERQDYLRTLERIRDDLASIGIEQHNLLPGEAEVGFLLPRELFSNHLDQLNKELKVIERIIRAFAEASGHIQPIEVRSISTSDPLFFFGLAPTTIAAIGAAVTWALNSWKQVEDIRKIRAETAKLQVFANDPIDKLFEDKIKQSIEHSVETKLTELLDKIEDTPRKHEQAVDLRWALESIVARVERGMTVEIRLLPPTATPEAVTVPQEDIAVFNELQQTSQSLVFPKIEGSPITALPPPEPH